jgi:hypothetical protein
MTLYKFTGGTLAKSSEVNSNFNLTLRSAGLTWINMLKDRALTMPANGGIFAEAYTANTGRQTSVVTAETTAAFDTNKYKTRFLTANEEDNLTSSYTFPGTTIDTNVWTSTVSGYVDDNRGAYNAQFDTPDRIRTRSQVSAIYSATYSGSLTANQTNAINIKGQTIIALDIQWTTTKVSSTPNNTYGRIFLKLRDSGTDVELYQVRKGGANFPDLNSDITRQWVFIVIDATNDLAYLSLDGGKSFLSPINISTLNDAQDWWIKFESGASHNGGGGSGAASGEIVCYEVKTGLNAFTQLSELYSSGEITHTIPAGTFPSDMSSSFLTYDPAEFEAGADVDYKWRNDAEDVETGWLAPDIVVNFTSLGFEPDQLIKRLKPKSSSPTAGFPSSRGVCVFGGKAL